MATNIRVRVQTNIYKRLNELEKNNDIQLSESKKVNKWLIELLSIKLGKEIEINEKFTEFRILK